VKYEFNEQQICNILVFLDRTEIKGLKELQAMNEIIQVMNNPVQEYVEDKD